MKPSIKTEIKPLLQLAAPVILSFVAGMFMQVVDTFFVGKLGPQAIGCVSVGNALFFALMVVGMGAIVGLDFLASHAFGAGKMRDFHESFIHAIYLATGVSAIFLVLMTVFAFHLDWFGIDPTLLEGSKTYLIIIALSLWPFLLFTALRQYLQAMGIAKPILWISLLANLVNIAGNYVFVWGRLGFESHGVEGSGWSTVIARTFMCLAAVVYVLRHDRAKNLGLLSSSFAFSRARAIELLRLGLPAAGQMLLEVGVFSFATLLAGRLGAEVLSAHQIVLHIASFTFMMPLGLSIASAVRMGQAIGAKEIERAKRIGWLTVCLGFGWMVFSGVTLYALATPLVSLFTESPAVIEVGVSLMMVVALFQVSDGLQVSLTGVLRGVADTKTPMIANFVGHWCAGLPVGALLCFKLGWGVKGLWVGLWLGLSLVAVSLLIVWKIKSTKLVNGELPLNPPDAEGIAASVLPSSIA